MKQLIRSIERSILFPGSLSQGQPETAVELSIADRLIHRGTPHRDEVAIAVHRGQNAANGAIIFCYGNGMNLASAVGQLAWLSAERWTVAIPEYVGYGLSTGQPSEAGCVAAAEAALAVLHEEYGLNADHIVFAGWSLGAAVALELAVRHPPAGLVLISAFTSVRAMARAIAPWGFGGLGQAFSRLADATFDNRTKLSRVTCPVFLAHGQRDTLVPFTMANELAATLPVEQLTRVSLPLAGHNDVFENGGVVLQQAYQQFCTRCLTQPEDCHGGQSTCMDARD